MTKVSLRFFITSGFVLFACMFLPAVSGCDKPAYPYEYWQLTAPYFFGFTCFLTTLMAALKSPDENSEKLYRFFAKLHFTVYGAGVIAYGVFLNINSYVAIKEIFFSTDDSSTIFAEKEIPGLLAATIFWWLVLLFSTLQLKSIRQRKHPRTNRMNMDRLLLISFLSGSLLSFSFFLFFFFDKHYYGIDLSIITSLSIAITAIIATIKERNLG